MDELSLNGIMYISTGNHNKVLFKQRAEDDARYDIIKAKLDEALEELEKERQHSLAETCRWALGASEQMQKLLADETEELRTSLAAREQLIAAQDEEIAKLKANSPNVQNEHEKWVLLCLELSREKIEDAVYRILKHTENSGGS